MTFFSGFSLKGEETLFDTYRHHSDFCVSGFSLGAIEAFEYVLSSTRRIDRLQLFSPAFFQDKEEKFKRVQALHFKKNRALYIENFLENIAYPSSYDMRNYYHDSSSEELHKLLYYEWSREKLADLRDRSIMIELYLGECDKIIDVQEVKAFFMEFATITWIKNSGHILKDSNG